MRAAIWLAFKNELLKIAEIGGDSMDFRATQTNDGPPVQEWHQRGRLPGRAPARRMAKQADLRGVLRKGTQTLKATPQKLTELSLKGMARLNHSPIGRRVVQHVMDPGNTADLASTISGLGRLL